MRRPRVGQPPWPHEHDRGKRPSRPRLHRAERAGPAATEKEAVERGQMLHVTGTYLELRPKNQ